MLKIGHRGAAGLVPENTLASFQKAIDLGVDMVELDVHLCSSGELVVIHDDKVDRTTNGKGEVASMTLAQLKKLDAGLGQKIPTLTEVLDLVNRRVGVIIELKANGTVQPANEIIQGYVSQKGWAYQDFIVISFDHYRLLKLSQLNRLIRLGPIIEAKPIGYAEFAVKLPAYSIHLAYAYVDQNFIQDAHRRGFQVVVWTVNELKEIKRFKSLGVDGVTSDYPDRL